MTASLREQITARIYSVLSATNPGGAQVNRSRVESLDRGDVPAITIKPSTEQTSIHAQYVDHSQFDVLLDVTVRGDPFDQLADAVITPMHAALMADFSDVSTVGSLGMLVSFIRRTQTDWSAQEADQTTGVVECRYQIVYLSDSRDISKSPF